MHDRPLLLLSPNVSERMGGEALKALHILKELHRQGWNVHQLTHARVRLEMQQNFPDLRIHYFEDSAAQIALDRLGLQWPLGALNVLQMSLQGRKIARRIGARLIHITSPTSPVYPHPAIPGAPVIIGPLNGNISYPPAFKSREPRVYGLSRRLLPLAQAVLGRLAHGKREAQYVFAAGGRRTLDSLLLAGCPPTGIVETLDSGIDNGLKRAQPIEHLGRNYRFVFVGRLVPVKGCDLILRALAVGHPSLTLDIIGDGPERQKLEALGQRLGLGARLRFRGWLPAGEELYAELRAYRGLVFPSLAESNGIVVQEAMMLGLPVIALDWGGPSLLLNATTGILLQPEGEDEVISGLAGAMLELAEDPTHASALALAAREHAERKGFAWEDVITGWAAMYARAMAPKDRNDMSVS